MKPLSVGQPHRELQQPELQQRAAPGQEVEPRTRTPWRRAPCRSARATRRARGGPSGRRCAAGSPTVSSTTKSSSPPAGTPSMMTLEIAMCAAVNAFSASACSASAALTVSASSLACCQQRGPLLRRGRADLLAGRLLLGAQVVGGRDRGAPGGVGRPAARRRAPGPRRGRAATRAPRPGLRAAASGRSRAQPYFRCRQPSPGRPPAQPHNVTSASLVTAPGAPVTMERMLDAPDAGRMPADERGTPPRQRSAWWRSLQPRRPAARCC